MIPTREALSRLRRAGGIHLVGAALVVAALVVPALLADEPTTGDGSALLLNERHPLPELATGGLPEGPDALAALAAAGYRTLVDLRTEAEVDEGIEEAADAIGLGYVRIPIAGDADLDLASARALDALLDEPARFPVAVVCRSGNRSGALLAVEAFWLDGSGAERALALGREAGLTRLEPSVRILLGLPPAEPPAEAPAEKPPVSGEPG